MSTLRVNTIQNALGNGDPSISGAAKAWVNFNGTGTVAIRASFNVSSITDNATGQWTVNFTNAMTDANYATVMSMSEALGAGFGGMLIEPFTRVRTASAVRVQSLRYNVAAWDDSAEISVTVFR